LGKFIWQKINQKNTWELGLIDHLSEIIQAGEEEDDETNFQKVPQCKISPFPTSFTRFEGGDLYVCLKFSYLTGIYVVWDLG
jgi:hypothetical protein